MSSAAQILVTGNVHNVPDVRPPIMLRPKYVRDGGRTGIKAAWLGGAGPQLLVAWSVALVGQISYALT